MAGRGGFPFNSVNPQRRRAGRRAGGKFLIGYSLFGVTSPTQRAMWNTWLFGDTESGWILPWAEPVIRLKVNYTPQNSQFLAFVQQPAAVTLPYALGNGWISPTDRRLFRTGDQQFSAFVPHPAPIPYVVGYAWSEPVIKVKAGLPVADQLYGTSVPQIVTVTATPYNLGFAWSQPQRDNSAAWKIAAIGSGTASFNPYPPPTPTTGDFTVSGATVIDQFITTGVSYTYAGISHRTN